MPPATPSNRLNGGPPLWLRSPHDASLE
jgi:hypothetical protein